MKKHKAQNPVADLLKNKATTFAGAYGNIYEYYVCGAIESSEEYTEWFHQIRNANTPDIIKLHINSPGGDLFTAIQFVHVLAETEAQICGRNTRAPQSGPALFSATGLGLNPRDARSLGEALHQL